jgi:hypothetical protein
MDDLHDELRANRVRCLMAEWRRVANSERPEISPADQADRRFRVAERKHAQEQREQQEAARVRDWLERRNYEENYHRGETVTTAKAESGGDDGWDGWRRFIDSRIQRYFEARIEKMIERRVEERMLEIRSELTEVATATRKAIQAMAQALDKHAELIRELAKRNETDVRSDNSRLRVVN